MEAIVPLKSACEVIFTGLPPRLRVKSDSSGLPVRVLGLRAINNDGAVHPGFFETYDLLESPPRSARPLEKDDVLLSIRGSAPKTALIEVNFEDATYASGNLAVLRPKRDSLDASYLWSFLMGICSNPSHPLLTRATTQQLSIRMSDLSNLTVRMPDMKDQREIGAAALALRDAVTAEREALQHGERTFRAFFTTWFSTQ